jgi:hypothetical protein
LSTHAPELFDIPGMTFRDRVAELGGAPPSAYSAGTVRTALPPREAVAKIAERFAAKGWVERSAAVSDDTTTQRFELVEGAYRWDALLVFDRRSDGVYGVLIAISDSRSQRPVR